MEIYTIPTEMYKGAGAAIALIDEVTNKITALRYVELSSRRDSAEDIATIHAVCAELKAISTSDDESIKGGDASCTEFCCTYTKRERRELGIAHAWF